jgi:hypothetical protein
MAAMKSQSGTLACMATQHKQQNKTEQNNDLAMATMIEWRTYLHVQAQTHNTTQITNNTKLHMQA